MKKILLSICATLALTSLIACGNDTSNASTSNNDSSVSSNISNNNTLDANNSLESSLSASISDTTQIKTASNQAAKASGLNPEHGQPGHRCDIEVGAPLSSAPAIAPVQQQQIQPQSAAPQMQVQPQVAPAAQKTAPGFSGKPNPEHGQPGHRCDLQVGEILP